MDANFQFRADVIKHEMDAVQEGIRTYGKVQFTIKGWAITVFTGVLAFALENDKPMLFPLCVIAVVLFWILDSIFKSIQTVYIKRATTIEMDLRESFSSGNVNLVGKNDFPGTETAFEAFKGRAEFCAVVEAARTPQIMLMYGAMILGIVILARITP
jgi:hypothetical protein